MRLSFGVAIGHGETRASICKEDLRVLLGEYAELSRHKTFVEKVPGCLLPAPDDKMPRLIIALKSSYSCR